MIPCNRLATLALLALSLAPAAIERGAEPVRLATFNIHHAEGPDGRLDLERVAAAVRGSDLVAFQEVDVRFRDRSGKVDQAAALGKALGGSVAFGGNLIDGDGQYGVALVSRFPILSSRNHPLPRSPGREKAEPRGLLEAEVDVRGTRLRVYVTHLAHDSAADRALQVDAIRARVAAGTGPAVVMGDLNLRPDSADYSRLSGTGPAPVLIDTWTVAGRGPGATIGLDGDKPGRIDYILATPDIAGGFSNAHVDAATRASDHQPVLVDLAWPPAG